MFQKQDDESLDVILIHDSETEPKNKYSNNKTKIITHIVKGREGSVLFEREIEYPQEEAGIMTKFKKSTVTCEIIQSYSQMQVLIKEGRNKLSP